jgi:HAT1-interacting factor 1
MASPSPLVGLQSSERYFLASGSGGTGNGPILSFSGDVEDPNDTPNDTEDPTIDIFAQAAQTLTEAEPDDEDEAEDGEPEDDFNAAWEVLDLARAIYEKQKEDGDDDEVKLKLADTYITLGDVSLETGKYFHSWLLLLRTSKISIL